MATDAALDRVIQSVPLFAGLDVGQRARVAWCFTEHLVAAGEALLREGQPDPHLYIIREGRGEVRKATADGRSEQVINTVGAGDVLGELKVAGDHPSSATVVAMTPLRVWRLPLAALAAGGTLQAMREPLLANVARILSARLRTSSTTAADAKEGELEEGRRRMSAAQFAVQLMSLLSLYGLLMSATTVVGRHWLPSQAVVSTIGILAVTVPVWRMIRRSPFPLADYGFTGRGWRRALVEGVLFTLPLLALMTAAKLLAIGSVARLAHEPLFNTHAICEDRPFSVGFWLVATAGYALVCPVQEVMTRGGFQASMLRFMPGRPGRTNWTVVVVSNLIAASLHTYIGFWFALATFVPGLFWGWMFDRQRSLVGVSVSHMLLGVYALNVLGVQGILGGH